MNTRETTAIAIKLLAIWLLVNVVLNVPNLLLIFNTVASYKQEEIPKDLYISVVLSSLVIGIIASFLLFRTSNSVLNNLPAENNNDTNNISQQFLLQLGGVYFIVSSLIALLSTLVSLKNQTAVETANYFFLLGSIFELSVGLHMTVNSNKWVSLFNKLRGRI